MNTKISGPCQYSVLEAAEYLRLHYQTVYGLIRDDLIDHHRKGRRRGRIYFFEEDLNAYLTGNTKRRARS
jgi:excisionase family DNA binding protein